MKKKNYPMWQDEDEMDEMDDMDDMDEMDEKPMKHMMMHHGKMPMPMMLAHAYVPWQHYDKAFSPQEALMKGTLFPELWGAYPIPE